MIIKNRRKPGVADVSDLRKNPVVKFQHRWYLPLILGMGFGVPTLLPGLLWGDWLGGFLFAGAARLTFVHHVRFLPLIPVYKVLIILRARSASTPSLTGWEKHPSMTNTLPAIISSQRS